MATINRTPSLFSPAKAESIALEMKSQDEDWDYRVDHFDNDYSRISIFDKNGDFVDYFCTS